MFRNFIINPYHKNLQFRFLKIIAITTLIQGDITDNKKIFFFQQKLKWNRIWKNEHEQKNLDSGRWAIQPPKSPNNPLVIRVSRNKQDDRLRQ